MAVLQVLAAPGLPGELYVEDTIVAVLALLKQQLQANVLAFHSPAAARLYRPELQGEPPLPPVLFCFHCAARTP